MRKAELAVGGERLAQPACEIGAVFQVARDGAVECRRGARRRSRKRQSMHVVVHLACSGPG
jgi:hypothetical protein